MIFDNVTNVTPGMENDAIVNAIATEIEKILKNTTIYPPININIDCNSLPEFEIKESEEEWKKQLESAFIFRDIKEN